MISTFKNEYYSWIAKILFVIAIILTTSISIQAEEIILIKKNVYPIDMDDYYFRPLVDLSIVDNHLFAVENFGHQVIKFSIKDDVIQLVKIIGKSGQGPGDLIFPTAISIFNKEILVKDNASFTFYDLDGNYINRFKSFIGKIPFFLTNNKIYWINFDPKDTHLIQVLSKTGETQSNFGKKLYSINFNKFKGLGHSKIEKLVYDGYLFSNGNNIFYVNEKFGDIIVFDFNGNELGKKNISQEFGDNGRFILDTNIKIWLKEGFDLSKTDNFIPNKRILEDACLVDNRIYLLSSNWLPEKKSGESKMYIIALDPKSLQKVNEYTLQKSSEDSIICFAVKMEEGNPSFYFFIRSIAEGDVLALYKIKDEKIIDSRI